MEENVQQKTKHNSDPQHASFVLLYIIRCLGKRMARLRPDTYNEYEKPLIDIDHTYS